MLPKNPEKTKITALEKPSGHTTSVAKVLLKAVGLTIAVFLMLVLVSITALAIAFNTASTQFESTAQKPLWDILSRSYAAWQTTPAWESNKLHTWLILGLDTIPERDEPGVLTDSIILAVFDPDENTVTLLSFPRDLWIPESQTKINALYYYGTQQNPENPTALVTETLESLSGISIDKTIIITPKTLDSLIYALGGLEITIPESFTDEQYPAENPDSQNVYQTISFSAGEQFLSAQRVVQYTRSRKAAGVQGSDDARASRQRQVLNSLFSTLTKQETLTNPELLGKLWLWYETELESQVSLEEVIAAGKLVMNNEFAKPTISSLGLPVFPNDPEGVIINPPISAAFQNQWVYTFIDQTAFKNWIQERIPSHELQSR